MSIPAIRTDNLTQDFGAVRALDNLSFEVPAGIVFGFLGPNGAGKTTTIRLLLGILEQTDGQVQILGLNTRKDADKIRTRTGALLEHTGLYERLSVEDNLEFYGRVWHIPVSERRDRIKELLSRIDLWDRRKEQAAVLSRGMKQKLAAARAIMHRPALLFLDEPTAGLDPIAASAFRDELESLVRSEGLTVFLTTHNLFEAEKLCSLIGVINGGKLMALGHPDELRSMAGKTSIEIIGRGFTEKVIARIRDCIEVEDVRIENSKLEIILTKDESSAPLVELMVREGVAIEEVKKGTASLEEAFLKLMEDER